MCGLFELWRDYVLTLCVVYYFRHLEKLEFELPRDPDVQKEEMLKITEEEHYRYIHPKDLERIQYYLTTVSEFFYILRPPIEMDNAKCTLRWIMDGNLAWTPHSSICR